MSEFLRLYDKIKSEYELHLTITANSSMWKVKVHRLDTNHGTVDYIVVVEEKDAEIAFAEAHFKLIQWIKNHPEMKK